MPVTTVPDSATPNAGRITFNENDLLLESQLTDLDASLTAHKTGTDHDTRYYTKAEIEAIVASVSRRYQIHGDDVVYVETGTSYVIKLAKQFLRRAGDTAVRIVGRAYNDPGGGGNTWHVRLKAFDEDGITFESAEASGNNGAFGVTPNFNVAVPIGAFVTDGLLYCTVELRKGGGTSATIQGIVIVVE